MKIAAQKNLWGLVLYRSLDRSKKTASFVLSRYLLINVSSSTLGSENLTLTIFVGKAATGNGRWSSLSTMKAPWENGDRLFDSSIARDPTQMEIEGCKEQKKLTNSSSGTV